MATSKVSFKFNPFKDSGVSVPKEKREEAREAVKDYVLEQVLSHAGAGKSPVAGGAWKKSLSKDYKKKKGEQSSAGFANMELSGKTLNDLEVVEVGKDNLSLQIEGDRAPILEGNNLGSYGREPDRSKAREIIPPSGGRFNNRIGEGIKRILQRFEEDDE